MTTNPMNHVLEHLSDSEYLSSEHIPSNLLNIFQWLQEQSQRTFQGFRMEKGETGIRSVSFDNGYRLDFLEEFEESFSDDFSVRVYLSEPDRSDNFACFELSCSFVEDGHPVLRSSQFTPVRPPILSTTYEEMRSLIFSLIDRQRIAG